MVRSWAASESEVVRVMRTMEHNAHPGEENELFDKFFSAKREPIRLAAALRGYFLPDVTASHRSVYDRYLREHGKNAAGALIEAGKDPELLALLQTFPMEEALLTELISTAARMRRTEALALLLRWKQEHFGFHGRDLTL